MELNKDRILSETLRCLCAEGDYPNKLREDAEHAAELLLKSVFPAQVTAYSTLALGESVRLTDMGFGLEGENIKALLLGCGSCALFCATLGSGADALIRQWSYRDRGFSLVLDACANSAIEEYCDFVEGSIQKACEERGLFITDRYSPGYGDLPLTEQKKICAVLNTSKSVGVTLNESCLMTPQKSVTAIIGIADSPRRHGETGCSGCTVGSTCEYRKKGMTCYVQKG